MIRVAILDMNNDVPNLGLGNIKEIVRDFSEPFDWQVFDVRFKGELPDMSYDIYISSGGPGSPLEGDGVWDVAYFDLVDRLWAFNKQEENNRKKYFFAICHSFQMVAHHFRMGKISPRKSMSFGTFPIHKTEDGNKDEIFSLLPDPFYAADFRNWQLVDPDPEVVNEMGATILALEKVRPHVGLERAVMAIRFSNEFFGTQFHPEADPIGMLKRFREADKRQHVIENYGADKYENMIAHIHDPEKLSLTHDIVIPTFLAKAVKQLKSNLVLVR